MPQLFTIPIKITYAIFTCHVGELKIVSEIGYCISCQGQPVITINGKDYVKVNGIKVEYELGKYGGTSSIFPDSWDVPKVLEEVEHAVKNNHGSINPTNPGVTEYFGYSSDGKVKIHFYYTPSNGKINSYFPKI